MREILFRGKSVNDGEWVQGSLVVTTIEPADDTPIKHYHIEDMTIGVFPNGFQSGVSETVNPNTVGQYTGLTDKNGKKIFEGDIVRHWNGSEDGYDTGRVYWDTNYCGWRRTTDGFFHQKVVDTFRMNLKCIYEVIGNIYDNPELLEVSDNG